MVNPSSLRTLNPFLLDAAHCCLGTCYVSDEPNPSTANSRVGNQMTKKSADGLVQKEKKSKQKDDDYKQMR